MLTTSKAGTVTKAESSERSSVERRALAGRHYQPLSGYAATDDYLCNEVYKLPSEWCWRCSRGERQFRHNLFVNYTACELQIRHMWKDLGTLCK